VVPLILQIRPRIGYRPLPGVRPDGTVSRQATFWRLRGHVTALLDWEEAELDWQVWDLASSIGPFCSTADGALDGKAAKEYIDSYRIAGGRVPPEGDDLIVPLLRIKRILEVLRAPTDRHPQWDYQLANLRAYQVVG